MKRGARHRLRRLIIGFVVLILAIPLAVLLTLQSSPGEHLLRHQLVDRVNALIAGHLEIDHLSLKEERLELRGIRLFAPGELEPVVSIDRVFVDARVLALARHRVVVPLVSVDEPRIRIVQEGTTTNLSRAIAPRAPPKPSSPGGGPPNISLDLRLIEVRRGAIEVAGKQSVAIDRLSIGARTEGRLDDLHVALALALNVRSPVERPVILNTVVHWQKDRVGVDLLDLRAGYSHLLVSGDGALDGSSAVIRIEDALISPRDVTLAKPDLHLLGSVRLAGKATLANGSASVNAQLTLPSGWIDLTSVVRLPSIKSALGYDVVADIDSIDPQRVMAGLPRARITARIGISGEGVPPHGHGTIRVQASGLRYARLEIERIGLLARFTGLHGVIDRLAVRTADATVEASGRVDQERVDLRFEVTAPSLAETRAKLVRGLGLSLPPMSGAISVAGSVEGPFHSPALQANVHAPSLGIATVHADNLIASIGVESIRPEPKGTVDLSVSGWSAGEKSGASLQLKGRVDGRRAMLAIAGNGAIGPIRLLVDGTRERAEKGQQRWILETLHVSALGVDVDSLRPASISFGRGGESVEGLALDAGPLGRLTVDADIGASGPLDVLVALQGVHLENLPGETPRPVGGTLDGTVRVGGTVKAPTMRAILRVTGLHGPGIENVSLALDGRYDGDRADLSLNARRAGVEVLSLIGTTKIDTAGVRRGGVEWKKLPIDLRMDLTRFELGWLKGMPGIPPGLTGTIVGRVSASGALGAPRVDATIHAASVTALGMENLEAVLDIQAAEHIRVSIDVMRDSADLLSLQASTEASPVRLAGLAQAERFKVPLNLSVKVGPTPLGQSDATLVLTASGTADEPKIHLNATVKDIRLKNGATLGTFEAVLDSRHITTTFHAALTNGNETSFEANASVHGSFGAQALLKGRDAVMSYPAEASVNARNFDLSLLNGLSPMVDEVGGTFDLAITQRSGRAKLRDIWKSLALRASVKQGRFAIAEVGTFTDVDLNIEGSGEKKEIRVTELHGKSGSGGFSMPADAPIHFEADENERRVIGSFSLDFDRFPVVQAYQTRAIVSLHIRTEADKEPAPIVVRLEDHSITIDRLVLARGIAHVPSALPKGVQSLSPNPDIVLVTAKKPPASTGPGWRFILNRVDIPEKECSGKDASLTCGPFVIDAPLGNRILVSTSAAKPLTIRAGADGTVLRGVVQVDGTVSLIKSQFEIERVQNNERSNIDFTGRPVDNPLLDVKARLDNDVQRLVVSLTGTLKDPQKTIDADPPFADDNEAYYFIVTGARQTQAQQSDPANVQTQLVNAGVAALGSAAFGIIQDKLLGFLPEQARLDTLEISPSTTGGAIGSVRAGKRYLGGNLQITGAYNPGANPLLNQNTYEVRGSYRMTPDLSLQGLGGTAGHYEMNLVLQHSYCTSKQRKEGLCGACTDTDARAGKCCDTKQKQAGNCS